MCVVVRLSPCVCVRACLGFVCFVCLSFVFAWLVDRHRAFRFVAFQPYRRGPGRCQDSAWCLLGVRPEWGASFRVYKFPCIFVGAPGNREGGGGVSPSFAGEARSAAGVCAGAKWENPRGDGNHLTDSAMLLRPLAYRYVSRRKGGIVIC